MSRTECGCRSDALLSAVYERQGYAEFMRATFDELADAIGHDGDRTPEAILGAVAERIGAEPGLPARVARRAEDRMVAFTAAEDSR